MKDTYCSHCGTEYEGDDRASYPRTCLNCGQQAWDNPIPVVVCVQTIYDKVKRRMGLLIARRAIEPHLGGWALVGGHMENGETVEEAAAREFREETGLDMGLYPKIVMSHANGRGHVLIELRAQPLHLHEVEDAIVLCEENSEWKVLYDIVPNTLCFPIHQRIAEDFFEAMRSR